MKTQHGTTREKRRGEKRRGGGNRATEPINHHACSVRSYNYGWASKRRGRRGKEKRGEKRGGRKEKKREERFHFSPPQAPLGFEKSGRGSRMFYTLVPALMSSVLLPANAATSAVA